MTRFGPSFSRPADVLNGHRQRRRDDLIDLGLDCLSSVLNP
ncbi:MAG: hypothetical protein ACI4B4_03520 [Segatella copri]